MHFVAHFGAKRPVRAPRVKIFLGHVKYCFNTTLMRTAYVHQCPKQIASFVVGLPQTASARTMT